MAGPFDFTGQNIEDSYQRVLQTDGTSIYDGTGSLFSLPSAFPYTGSARITGSLGVTGSISVNGSGSVPALEINSNQANIAIPNQIKFSQAGGNILFSGYAGTISDSYGLTLSTAAAFRPVRIAGTSGLYIGSLSGISTPAGSILTEGNVGVRIATPSASLHVVGVTATSFLPSSSLLVENSARQGFLKVEDGGIVYIGKIGDGEMQINSGNFRTYLKFNSNKLEFRDYQTQAGAISSTGLALTNGSDPVPINRLDVVGKAYIGPTIAVASASLHIKGATSSSLSSSLLIQNANLSASLVVLDNGIIYSNGPTFAATNTIFGNQATLLSTTGSFVTAIGYQALYNNTGLGNTAIGYQAGDGNTTGTENTYVGYIADGFNNNVGATGIGSRVSAGGFYSVAVGYAASTDGGVSIGRQSRSSANTISIGTLSGYGSGNTNSVFIGNETAYNTNSKTGNVFIGYQAGYNENTSNKLFIANSNTTTPLIGGDFANARLGININPGSTTSTLHVKGSGATNATTAFRVENSNTSSSLVVLDNGNVGIGGPAETSTAYKLRVHGGLWVTSFEQLQVLNGSSGVGIIRYYDGGATFRMRVYGTHPSEAVKGILSIDRQDLTYSSLENTITHTASFYQDHPSLVIRSNNTAANSFYLQNYMYASGALFVTSQPTGGDTSFRFKPSASITSSPDVFVINTSGVQVTGSLGVTGASSFSNGLTISSSTTINDAFAINIPEAGGPIDDTRPAGFYKATINGVEAFLPYYL